MGQLADVVGKVSGNVPLAPGVYLMRLAAEPIARAVAPGQFVHLAVPGMEGHLLRRPMSVYAADAQGGEIELLYQCVGFGTRRMAGLAVGAEVGMIGPIGRGWEGHGTGPGRGRALLVGGGIGAAPLFMLAAGLLAQGAFVDVVLGAQTKAALVCRERFAGLLGRYAGQDVQAVSCATDDGSFGHAGLCTDLVETALTDQAYGYIAACGPEPMMRTVAGLAQAAGVRCEVSLERRMACGIGACLSCAVETSAGLKRACVDGPVFDAREVVFA